MEIPKIAAMTPARLSLRVSESLFIPSLSRFLEQYRATIKAISIAPQRAAATGK
jgi:hypothetical protein